MIQRIVAFLLQTDGSVTPSVPQYGGVKGEHNVTTLSFSKKGNLLDKDGDLVRLSFCLGDGTVLSSDLLDVNVDMVAQYSSVTYALPQTLTMAGGQLCVRLVMSRMDATGKEIEVFRSGEAVVYFDEAPVENGTPFWTGVSEMLKRTTTAKDEAVTAKEEAFNAYLEANKERKKAEAARDAAVDAYHETTQDIAEQNKVLEDMRKTVSANALSIKTHESMLNAASENAKRLASDIEANAAAIRQNKQACDDLAANTANAIYNIGFSKLNNSGHEPDMFLGTDGNGNVVTKDAPSMDLPFTSVGDGFYIGSEGGLYVDENYIASIVPDYTSALISYGTLETVDGLKMAYEREGAVYHVLENGTTYIYLNEEWQTVGGGLNADEVSAIVAAQIQAYDSEVMTLLGEDGDGE